MYAQVGWHKLLGTSWHLPTYASCIFNKLRTLSNRGRLSMYASVAQTHAVC